MICEIKNGYKCIYTCAIQNNSIHIIKFEIFLYFLEGFMLIVFEKVFVGVKNVLFWNLTLCPIEK